MYVDASALTAILKNEPERPQLIQALKTAERPITSAISVFETTMALAILSGSCASASGEVVRFVDAAEIAILPIDRSHLTEMAVARDRYGKGSGHPAQLNLGDCFSYAIAKVEGVPLLYKGNDFAQTDLA